MQLSKETAFSDKFVSSGDGPLTADCNRPPPISQKDGTEPSMHIPPVGRSHLPLVLEKRLGSSCGESLKQVLDPSPALDKTGIFFAPPWGCCTEVGGLLGRSGEPK
jgi:hypothetical protein